MTATPIAPRPAIRWLLPLAAGCLLLVVVNGRWIWPAVAWVAAAPWLLFIRRAPAAAIPLGLVAATAVQLVTWYGLIPAPGMLYVAIVCVYAAAYFLPFVAVRLLVPRLSGWHATLVYPAAAVGIEFLFHRFATPYGSWFSLAYTQTGNLALLQLVSLTGIAGIAAMIAWCNVVIAERWEGRDAPWRREQVLAGALAVILVWGQLRLGTDRTTEVPIRMAGLVADRALADDVDRLFVRVVRGAGESDPAWDSLRTAAAQLTGDLFERTAREARAGARLVAWSETAGRILKRDETAFLERAALLAREQRIYLALAYGAFSPGAPKPLENRVAVIDTAGTVAFIADKAHPIVGPESPMLAAGDGRLAFLQTPFGRLTAVVCHDLDFPRLIRQAGRDGAALMIGPSDDWRAITDMHASMAMVRAVEQGVALFRPTAGGRSEAVTSLGVRAAMLEAPDDAFIVALRPAHRRTVYAAVGDLFAWGMVAVLVLLAGRTRGKQ